MTDIQARILQNVEFDLNGGCWLWNGSTAPGGYGKVGVRRKSRLAHRLAWASVNGPIPDGMLVRHKCDVPACVNPDHLQLGTHADNTRDCLSRGRHVGGNARKNLTPDQLAFIRSKLAEGWRDARIADALGYTRGTIGDRRRAMMTEQTP